MEIFQKIYKKITALIVILFIIYANIFVVSNIYDTEKSIKEYKYESSKYSLRNTDSEICSYFKCSAIKEKNNITFFDKGFEVYEHNNYSENINLISHYYIDFDNLGISIKENDRYIYLDLFQHLDKSYFIFILTLPILIIIFSYTIGSTILTEQREGLIRMAGAEALMTNKSMIMITENIHHELNTPMEVLDNKIEKIKRKIEEVRPDLLYELSEDFEFICTAEEQVRNILDKMKDFKQLRYSNGNQNIYNIAKNAFKMVAMSIPNFTFNIEAEFKNFGINSDSLKNADLLNILINHIKNSLEGGANKVHVVLSKYESGLLYLRILDNGSGIPEKMKSKIFNPNFSTKDDFNGIRGNGMYLNKQLLTIGGGDVRLVESSSKGTTLELIIPCVIKNAKSLDKKS